jgi:hypothetical protein
MWVESKKCELRIEEWERVRCVLRGKSARLAKTIHF